MAYYYIPDESLNDQRKITMIETPRYAETNDYLFSFFYTNANKSSPEFTTRYKSTEQLVEINFTTLILRLHQEALSQILYFVNTFQSKVDTIVENSKGYRIATAGPPLGTIEEGDETLDEDDKVEQKVVKKISKKVSAIVDSIKVKVVAQMEQVAIEIENYKRPIASLTIANMNAGVTMKTSYTELTLKLQDIIVKDLNTETIHSTVHSSSHSIISINPIFNCLLNVPTDFVGGWRRCPIMSNCFV